jgi:phosphatidylglycerophosphatase A
MKNIWRQFLFVIAVGFGLGYGPLAPGSWGSLFALPFFWLWGGSSVWFWLVTAVFALLSVPSANLASDRLGTKDPGQVVVDEILGQLITFICLPLGGWKVMLLGFLVFRAMDTLKPPPARAAERLPRGWGIVLDDVVAGLYANIILQVFLRIIYPHLSPYLPPLLTL